MRVVQIAYTLAALLCSYFLWDDFYYHRGWPIIVLDAALGLLFTYYALFMGRQIRAATEPTPPTEPEVGDQQPPTPPGCDPQ